MLDTKTSIIGLVAAASLGLLPATIAKKKGWSFIGWWCYGFLIWIVAFPHALLLKPNRSASLGQPANGGSTSGGG